MIDGWIVVLNGDHHVKDVARASLDKLNSFKSTSTVRSSFQISCRVILMSSRCFEHFSFCNINTLSDNL